MCHDGVDVFGEGVEIEGGELVGVVEVVAHRVDERGVLVEHFQIQLIRPPVLIGRRANGRLHRVRTVHDRTLLYALVYFLQFGVVCHGLLLVRKACGRSVGLVRQAYPPLPPRNRVLHAPFVRVYVGNKL